MYYVEGSGTNSVGLYAALNKGRTKTYLCSDSSARDANGNRNLDDVQCFFRNESDGSNRFQIVREKDGWLAMSHDDYVAFHVRISLQFKRSPFYTHLRLFS